MELPKGLCEIHVLIFVSQATILPMPSFHRPAAARSNELLPMPLSPTKGPPQWVFFGSFQKQVWEDSLILTVTTMWGEVPSSIVCPGCTIMCLFVGFYETLCSRNGVFLLTNRSSFAKSHLSTFSGMLQFPKEPRSTVDGSNPAQLATSGEPFT